MGRLPDGKDKTEDIVQRMKKTHTKALCATTSKTMIMGKIQYIYKEKEINTRRIKFKNEITLLNIKTRC